MDDGMTVTDEEIDDFLAHYGVPGMKWGVRKGSSGRSGPSNRQLNKASRAKDRAKIDKQIDAARKRTQGTTRLAKLGIGDKGSKSQTEFKAAKAKYKQDKAQMGSREAKKILAKAKETRVNDIRTARTAKSGKEAVAAIFLNTGKTSINFRGNVVNLIPDLN